MDPPADDYTAFGLVANPWSFARSWTDGQGGAARATEQRPGLALLYPWATNPRWALLLEAGCEQAGQPLASRADLAPFGLRCERRSAHWLEYAWELGALAYRVRCFLGGPDVLVALWRVANRSDRELVARPRPSYAVWRADDGGGWQPGAWLARPISDREPALASAAQLENRVDPPALRPERLAGRPGTVDRAAIAFDLPVPPGGEASLAFAYGRAEPADQSRLGDLGQALASCREREAALLADDQAFWATCPRLSGDWPPETRRGFVYDFETTRMCLRPPGGVFHDAWPSWMVNWPRAVLAEAMLDLARLSYAQPALAQRAALSIFRDAPAPNLPCVFEHGEPNMLAADGEVCGTSPAWCVPFHNLRLLYLRHPDRGWLAELYPYLAAYLLWWTANRADPAGWTVYHCTWEAGEDNSPRLDPDREGDHVIEQFARPVELQAALADAAACLAFFAGELERSPEHAPPGGLAADLATWQAIGAAARQRVQLLWDATEARFRDWDTRRGGFIQPSGAADYWGTDPRRFSPLALLPLLFGQASAEQVAALRQEVEHYAQPPWCDWPSWSYVVLEAATKAGWYDFSGRLAWSICRRVYAENDRRALAPFERPLPGAAREYWPSDLAAWDASEGYGWGATTASFVIRQLCGFYEAEPTDTWALRLAPGLPPELLAGRRLELGPLQYRGRLLWLAYAEADADALAVELRLDQPLPLTVRDEASGTLLYAAEPAASHQLRLPRWRPARLEA